MADGSGVPQKKEVEEKEQRLRQSIAQNYSHIRNVENQLAELQLQLKLTSGPKKSALEMLRRKIEAKNELVAAARQKFAAAAKMAGEAEQELQDHERSKEQLCQELNLLVHQSATAEINKLEQLTQQLDSLSRGELTKPDAKRAVMELALAHQLEPSSNPLSAEDTASITSEEQKRASRSTLLTATPASIASPAQTKPSNDVAVLPVSGQDPGMSPTASTGAQTQRRSVQQTWQTGHCASKNRNNHNNRKEGALGAQKDALPKAASDSAGRFKGFE